MELLPGNALAVACLEPSGLACRGLTERLAPT